LNSMFRRNRHCAKDRARWHKHDFIPEFLPGNLNQVQRRFRTNRPRFARGRRRNYREHHNEYYQTAAHRSVKDSQLKGVGQCTKGLYLTVRVACYLIASLFPKSTFELTEEVTAGADIP